MNGNNQYFFTSSGPHQHGAAPPVVTVCLSSSTKSHPAISYTVGLSPVSSRTVPCFSALPPLLYLLLVKPLDGISSHCHSLLVDEEEH